MTNTISASRVAAVLGQSKWQTRLALYHELTGQAPKQEDNELLAEGRAFERTIAEIAVGKFGFEELWDDMPEMKFDDLSGHVDFVVVDANGKRAVLEIKNTLFFDISEEHGWGEPGTDRVPPAYWIQCQVYGWLLQQHYGRAPATPDRPEWIVGPFVADVVYLAARLRSGVQLYVIPIDHEFIKHAIAECSQFLDLVARGTPPDPEDIDDSRHRWLPAKGKVAQGTVAQAEWLLSYQKLGKAIDDLEEQRKALAMLILNFAQDSESIEISGVKVASVGANRKFDATRFQLEHPGICAHFQTLDVSAVREAHKQITDQYMAKPDNPATQTRVLRVNDKALQTLAQPSG